MTIDAVFDHNSVVEVTNTSNGSAQWREYHEIRTGNLPSDDLIGVFNTRHDEWRTEGVVTVETQQGDLVAPAKLRFTGGVNTGASVNFTVRTLDTLLAQVDHPIAGLTDRKLTAENMANGSTNRIVNAVEDVLVQVVEVSPDVWDVELLASGDLTDVAFIQLVQLSGVVAPTDPD